MQIQIKEIAKTKKAIKPFINFAWKIYAEDANWVPPLKLRQQDFLLKHPFFQHSQVAYFMAFDEKNEPIGRIAAIHNTRHNETHNENIGFFGSNSVAFFKKDAAGAKGRDMKRRHGFTNSLQIKCNPCVGMHK